MPGVWSGGMEFSLAAVTEERYSQVRRRGQGGDRGIAASEA